MTKPQALPRELREAVIARDGPQCQLCQVPVVLGGAGPTALNIDHVIQRAIGGSDALENLRVVCAQCNLTRPRPVTDEAKARRAEAVPVAARRRARRKAAVGRVREPDPAAERIIARAARLSARQLREGIIR